MVLFIDVFCFISDAMMVVRPNVVALPLWPCYALVLCSESCQNPLLHCLDVLCWLVSAARAVSKSDVALY